MFLRILEAAKKAQVIEDKLTDDSKQLINHLIKLFLFPKTQDINHWSNELYAFINDVPRLTTKGHKLPSYELIMRGIWTSWEGSINKRINIVIKHNSKLRRSRISNKEIESKIYDYCDWLARKLSLESIVEPDEVKEKVQELIKDIEVD